VRLRFSDDDDFERCRGRQSDARLPGPKAYAPHDDHGGPTMHRSDSEAASGVCESALQRLEEEDVRRFDRVAVRRTNDAAKCRGGVDLRA
jgi:hypothetical protein